MRSADRWSRWYREVVRLGRSAGLAAREVETLRAGTRRLVLHLRPDDVVARVVPRAALGAASRELALAAHLARAGAPVAPPLAVHAGPHVGRAVAVTFWAHLPATPPRGCTDTEHVAAYLALRRGLDALPAAAVAALPDFRRAVRGALTALRRTHVAQLTPGLSPGDRAHVAGELDIGLVRLRGWRLRAVPLHGDPHAGNLVRTRSSGVRGGDALRDALWWVDLEAACAGPVEWDLSALPDAADGAAVVPHDSASLATLRHLRSACVVAWCAAEAPTPDGMEAIRTHLALLRAS